MALLANPRCLINFKAGKTHDNRQMARSSFGASLHILDNII